MTDKAHQCVIIGIAGASASGKSLIASTLYRELREQVGDQHIGVIPEDGYYKDQSHLSMEERVKSGSKLTMTIPAPWITIYCSNICNR